MYQVNYTALLFLILTSLVIAQYDPYGQRPYNQNTDRPNYDRNNPNPYDNRDRQYDNRYDRPGQGLSDRERDRYGQGGQSDRDRYNNPYDRNRTYPGGYDRNRPDQYGPYGNRSDQYGPYGNRSDPYGQPYDRDHRYGQGPYDRYPGQQGGRFAGQDDGTCCEDYCYERDRDQYNKFGPVTAYQVASGKYQITQDTPQCKPILFWSLNKHGTNVPDQQVLQRLKGLERTREDVVRNYNEQTYPLRGRLCQEDFESLNRWRLNETLIYLQGKELSSEGKEELRMIARRFQTKYRDLLNAPYSESHYYFKYTNADRTYDSYQAYLEGLFNNAAFNVHAVIDTDDISRGYRSCYGGSSSSYGSSSSSNYDPYAQNSGYNNQRYGSSNTGYNTQGSDSSVYTSNSGYNPSPGGGYSSGSTYSANSGYNPGSGGYQGGYSSGSYGSNANPNRDYEYNQFKRNPEYMDMVKNVLRRLGFTNFMPNETVVEDIYNICRYEKAWYPNRPSPWCSAFNKKQLEVLEYAQDLREYFSYGYGSEDVSNRLGCGLLKDMYQRLQRGVDGYTSDPRVVVNFASEGSIQNLLVAMGVARDYTPLSAQNFYSQTRRKWRTADLSPFAANIVAVLNECDSTSRDMYKVMFYINENPMEFAECSSGLCSWDTVRSKFEDVVNKCDYCGASDRTKSQMWTLLGAVLIIFTYKLRF